MALHDTDARTPNRENPMPASHDEQDIARMAAGTNSVNPVSGPPPAGYLIANSGIPQIVASDLITVTISNSAPAGTPVSTTVNITVPSGKTYAASAFVQPAQLSQTFPIPYFAFGWNGSSVTVSNHARISVLGTGTSLTIVATVVPSGSAGDIGNWNFVYYVYALSATIPPNATIYPSGK